MRLQQLLLSLAVCCAAAVTASSQSQLPTQPEGGQAPAREKPPVRTQEQPDAPLRLTSETKWALPDQQSLEVYFKVENVGGRPVRAYTVRFGGPGGGSVGGDGCVFDSAHKAGKILQPGKSAGRSTWRSVPPSEVTSPVEIWVDFVEFADGSVWGTDTCQSAEWLDGLRAGGRVARRLFTKQLRERGLDALMTRLYVDDPDLAPPEGHSDVWKKAFRGAVNSVRERIRSANEDGGLPEVEDTLKKAFDAADDPQ